MKESRLTMTVLFALLGAAGCVGGVQEGGGSGGGQTTGSTNTTTGMPATTGTAGGSGGAMCVEPLPNEGFFTFTLAGANGETAECGTDYDQHQIVIEGAIQGSLQSGWTIDACPPNSGCAPLESVITVQADQLEVTIPEGAFVRATVTKGNANPPGMGGHCRKHLVIENLGVWSGLPNPVLSVGASEQALWLAGHDGVGLDLVDVYTVTLVPVCEVAVVDSVYDLRFDSPNAQFSAVSVPWGQTVDWIVGEGPIAGQYRARNLFARDLCCHLTGMHRYWVARAPTP